MGQDCGKESQCDKAEYPWFWGWDGEKQDFAGARRNDCPYTNEFKRKARG